MPLTYKLTAVLLVLMDFRPEVINKHLVACENITVQCKTNINCQNKLTSKCRTNIQMVQFPSRVSL